jgi:hypothetical protein
MNSNKFSEITLPRPDVTSPQFTEQVETLADTFDEIIDSMLEKLSSSSKKSVEEIRAEIDEMDDTDDDDDDDTTASENDESIEDDSPEESSHPKYVEEDPEIVDLISRLARLQITSTSIEDNVLVDVPLLARGRPLTRSPPQSRRERARSVPFRGREKSATMCTCQD